MPLLFSYGTLQQKDVQLSTFGRLLHSHQDVLIGFELGVKRVADPEFVLKSGKADHVIVTYTGDPQSRVEGSVLEVTDAELAQSDAYEPAGYERVSATLASGVEAWVYAAARS